MGLNHQELKSFLDKVGAPSLEAYLDAHGRGGVDGFDERLRWAVWNFREGERAEEAAFLVAHQRELRRILERGEAAWTKARTKRRGKKKRAVDDEEEVTDIWGLKPPDLDIGFHEDEDDEDSWDGQSSLMNLPEDVTQPPPEEREIAAARALIERAQLGGAGLSTIPPADEDAAEDSKDLLTFGTVNVEAPLSPTWVPRAADEPTMDSVRAPVFITPSPAPPKARAPEPQLEQVVDEDAPTPVAVERVQAPVPAAPAPLPETVAEVPAPVAGPAPSGQAPDPAGPPRRLPLVALAAVGAVAIALVSAGVTGVVLLGSEAPPDLAERDEQVVVPEPIAASDADAGPGVDAESGDDPAVDDALEAMAAPSGDAVAEVAVDTEIEGIEPPAEPEPIAAAPPAPDVQEREAPVAAPPAAQSAPAPAPRVETPPPVERPPTPAPAPVASAPEPAPEPAAVEPTPEPEPPPPAAPSIEGTWAGFGGIGPMRLVVESQTGTRFSGRIQMTAGGAEETHLIAGTIDASGAITMNETGGDATFTGNLDGTRAQGTWRASPGAAARQWLVVKQ